MAFPRINFNKNNLPIDEHLLTLAEEKLQALGKFIQDGPAVCDVEFEKVSYHEKGDYYRIEVNLEVAGKLYRAEASLDSFEKAIDEVRDELDKELRRDHDKQETLLRRGGRRLKEMLRFGR